MLITRLKKMEVNETSPAGGEDEPDAAPPCTLDEHVASSALHEAALKTLYWNYFFLSQIFNTFKCGSELLAVWLKLILTAG